MSRLEFVAQRSLDLHLAVETLLVYRGRVRQVLAAVEKLKTKIKLRNCPNRADPGYRKLGPSLSRQRQWIVHGSLRSLIGKRELLAKGRHRRRLRGISLRRRNRLSREGRRSRCLQGKRQGDTTRQCRLPQLVLLAHDSLPLLRLR